MNGLPTAGDKLKSFWEKPEGKFGKFVFAGGILGLGWFAYKILPFINTILENTLYFGILVVALVAFVLLISNKKIHALVSYLFQSLMRLIVGMFIEIDPIGILKSYVDDLKKKLTNIMEQIQKVKGQMTALREKIEENKKIRETSLKYAKAAQQQGKTEALQLYSRRAGRRQEVNVTYEEMLKKFEMLYRVLQKMQGAAEYYVEDITDQVEVLTEKRRMINRAYSAFKSALGIVQDGSEKRAIFDQTVEYMTRDYGEKLGEIEGFIDLSKGFMQSVDLQNGVMEAEAYKQLEDWEKRADSLILGAEKQEIIDQVENPDDVLDLEKHQPTVPKKVTQAKDKYRGLIQ